MTPAANVAYANEPFKLSATDRGRTPMDKAYVVLIKLLESKLSSVSHL